MAEKIHLDVNPWPEGEGPQDPQLLNLCRSYIVYFDESWEDLLRMAHRILSLYEGSYREHTSMDDVGQIKIRHLFPASALDGELTRQKIFNNLYHQLSCSLTDQSTNLRSFYIELHREKVLFIRQSCERKTELLTFPIVQNNRCFTVDQALNTILNLINSEVIKLSRARKKQQV